MQLNAVRSFKQDEGLTLIELLVVVAILGIIAAIAIPSVSGAMTNAKIGATEATMSTIQEALQAYDVTNGAYPTSLSELSTQTSSGIGGPVISAQSLNDGWGIPITYEYVPNSQGEGASAYLLYSDEGSPSANSTPPSSSPSSTNVIWARGGTATGTGTGTVSIGQTPTTSNYYLPTNISPINWQGSAQ
ncbi:hypothetical protein MM817_02082 [Acidibacillus sp. S0AB]|uniref:Type II secretion system protein GspG C-terminal domain-containing protein n=1 Tax=Sulfoacidibacillus ferrooxidans TaxID=2005001 RepID=A0A9X2AF79_9BACL|nr:hypothetical protein [Sulfoacidibacillus ferrooxidans]